MKVPICHGCHHAVIFNEGEEIHCLLTSMLFEGDDPPPFKCSARVGTDEHLTSSTEKLAKFLSSNFGNELSEDSSIRGASLTIAQRYRRLRDEVRGLTRFMETTGVRPPREEGETVFDWIRRGFNAGRKGPGRG